MIEQALYGNRDAGGYRFLARSPGFQEDWLAEAERLCTGFGERPAGVSCPACVFARPFGPRHVAIVQVADQGTDDTGRPGALGFRLLILPSTLYADLEGDLFAIVERFPAPWQAEGAVPALMWTFGPLPRRTVADLHKVLDTPQGPTLLGGAQALLDGGHLVFERREPDPMILRSLWMLLPSSSRCSLWPATYAFSNAHRFDVLVVPRAEGPEFESYVREAEAGDYPEGRYELSLQTAVEAGNQRDLDALLSRRSRAQMMRLALGLIAVFLLVPVVAVVLSAWIPGPGEGPRDGSERSRPSENQPTLARDYPRLSEKDRKKLAAALQKAGKQLHVAVPAGTTDADLGAALSVLDRDVKGQGGRVLAEPLTSLGTPQRQLRALLWKLGATGYNDPGVNVDELIEKLERGLDRATEGNHDGKGG